MVFQSEDDSRYAFSYCITHADGWVVNTLRNETETVFPTELITDENDRQLGEKLLSAILRSPIKIRKTEWGYICRREGG